MATINGAPYDPTTAIGKVRFFAADTDDLNYEFMDAEVTLALQMAGNNIRKAAGNLLMALAANRSRLAVSVRRGTVTEDLTKLASELRTQAKELIGQADADLDVPLEAIISPSYEQYSATKNILLEREDNVREAP